MIVHSGANRHLIAQFVHSQGWIDVWKIQKCSRINSKQLSGRSAAW